MVGIAADQYAGSKGLFVNFFGRPASTTAGVATLARKTGAAIIPAFNHMHEDGRHETVLHPAIHVSREGNAEQDIFDTTQKLMSILEEEIRQQPGRYLWAHRKWRKKK
jgi:KDO2-lipid IV(A) lauroyltransferase